ncbi:nucleotidyltransferase [Elizabethkingia anophelis]|nr:nucleotidyltransferase [Elizabethkingia anophelis]
MPMFNTTTPSISYLLENVGIALDITEAQYKEVVNRYTAVSNHLSQEGSALSRYMPDIKPQGSFLLGTMIRPLIEDDELDVDVVCRLKGKNSWWTQYDLKHAVKDQLITNADYERMLDEEGNRCWTLVYHEAAKFHMDILPAVVNVGLVNLMEKSFDSLRPDQIEELAIRITDKRWKNHKTETNSSNWMKSNPFGYAAWFKERANTSFYKSVVLNEAVEPLPEYQTDKETLVRVVQILKRHRDIMFGSNETRPISCIITTLAAYAYNKETDLIQALTNVLENFLNTQYIYKKYSAEHGKEIWWISNPVNPEENFADRWIEDPEREKSFFNWYEKAKADFAQIRTMDLTTAYRYLKELLGTRAVNEAIRKVGYSNLINESYQPVNYSPTLLSVSHRQRPSWLQQLQYNVEVHGHYKNHYGKHITITNRSQIPKNCNIYFVASTNVPKPFDVYWQVVNTGDEAARAGSLRGGIFHSQTAGKGGLNQKEYSSYSGLHWVECFIVKNGVCVARSAEFFVNID